MTSAPLPSSVLKPAAWLWLGGALAAGFLAFQPSLHNQLVGGDDDVFIRNHYFVQHPSFDSGWRLFTYVDRDLYQPLAMLSLMLDTALFGSAPYGHHVMNVVYHLLAIVAVWLLARRLLPGDLLPGLTALLWGVHPLHSETVGIAVDRIPMLSALFTFWAVERYLTVVARYPSPFQGELGEHGSPGEGAHQTPKRQNAETPKSALPSPSPCPEREGSWPNHLAIGGLLLLAQLCKATPLLAPAMFLLALTTPLDNRPWRARLQPALRFLVGPLIVTGFFTILAFYTTWQGNLLPAHYNTNLLFNAILTILALWQNALNAFCPLWLSAWHPRPVEVPAEDLFRAGAGLAVLLAVTVWRGWKNPVVWAGMAWWLLLLAPTLPLLTTRFQLTADRYSYVALPGLIVAVLAMLSWALGVWFPGSQTPAQPDRSASQPSAAAEKPGGTGFPACVLSEKTKIFPPLMGFSEASSVYVQSKAMFRINLFLVFLVLLAAGAGIWVSRTAVTHYRDAKTVLAQLERIYTLRDPMVRLRHAHALVEEGKLDEAWAEMTSLVPVLPDYVGLWRAIGGLAVRRNDLPAALQAADQLIARRPEASVGHQMRGQVLRKQGQLSQALTAYQEALARNQNDPKQYLEYAAVLEDTGDLSQARENYRLVTTRWPFHTQAWHLLGRVDIQTGHLEEAIAALNEATRLAPEAGILWGDLAAALAGVGRMDEARSAAEKALTLDPNLPGTRKLLEHLHETGR